MRELSSRPLFLALVVSAVALASSGCLFDTSETVAFGNAADDIGGLSREADAGTAIDAAVDPERDAEGDAGAPGSIFDPDDLTWGVVCPGEVSPTAGSCSLVLQDCSDGAICDLDGAPPDFRRTCVRPGGARDGEEGAACRPAQRNEDCAPGFMCVSDECHRFCRVADAWGCRSDQACKAQFGVDYGVCSDSC